MKNEKKEYCYSRPKKVELNSYVKDVLSDLDEYSDKVNEKTVQIFSHGMATYYINTEQET